MCKLVAATSHTVQEHRCASLLRPPPTLFQKLHDVSSRVFSQVTSKWTWRRCLVPPLSNESFCKREASALTEPNITNQRSNGRTETETETDHKENRYETDRQLLTRLCGAGQCAVLALRNTCKASSSLSQGANNEVESNEECVQRVRSQTYQERQLYLDFWDPYPHLMEQPSRRRPTRCNDADGSRHHVEASEYVYHLDHAGRIADSPSKKKQEAATTLLRDAIQKRAFSLPIAAGASKILGTDQQTPHGTNLTDDLYCSTRLPSWISRWSSSRSSQRHVCTAQRFHMDGEEQR